MEVRADITIRELNGEPAKIDQAPLVVRSHHRVNQAGGWVIIVTPDDVQYVVSATELEKAISACTGLK